jgi:exodeoxyribonuclease VII small subunit
MNYEQKEARLDEILTRLDNSETPMDQRASEAKEAAKLIMSMHHTLKSAKQEITQVFEEMERQKQALMTSSQPELISTDGKVV